MIVVIGPKAAVDGAPLFEFHQTLANSYAELSLDDVVAKAANVAKLNAYKNDSTCL